MMMFPFSDFTAVKKKQFFKMKYFICVKRLVKDSGVLDLFLNWHSACYYKRANDISKSFTKEKARS